MTTGAPKAMAEQEFVLPSGKFCRTRKMVAGDVLIAAGMAKDDLPMVAILFSRIVTIDDLVLTPQQYMDLDVQDHMAISRKIPSIDGPVR